MKRAAILLVLASACGAPAAQQPPESPKAVPAETPRSEAGVAECDEMLALSRTLYDCDKFKQLPPASAQAVRESLDTLRHNWQYDTDPEKKMTRASCVSMIDTLRQNGRAMGCSL